MNKNLVRKIWVANIHSLQFKFLKSFAKIQTLNTGTSELKSSEVSNITFAFPHLFFIKILWNKLPPWVTLKSTPHRCSLKWVILTWRMQNLEFINLKYITYTQPIALLLRKVSDLPKYPFNIYLYWCNELGTKQLGFSRN